MGNRTQYQGHFRPVGRYAPPYERLMRRVVEVEGCLIFSGSPTSRYGEVWNRFRMVAAHRLVWEHHNGPIPSGKQILHHCDNGHCVNIKHLFMGTASDNMRDMVAKGRGWSPRGEQHHFARLTWADVDRIRERLRNGETLKVVAADTSVTFTTIWCIGQGKTWKEENREKSVQPKESASQTLP